MNSDVKICRICLSIADNGFINLNERLLNLLKVLAPELPDIKTDNQIICLSCNFLVEASWVFKKTCHETLKKLNYYKRRRKENDRCDYNRKMPRMEVMAHTKQNYHFNNTKENVQNMQIVFNDVSSIATDHIKNDNESLKYETEAIDINNRVLDLSDDNTNDTVILSDSEVDETPAPNAVSLLNSLDMTNDIEYCNNLQTVPDKDNQVYKSHEFIDLEEFHKIMDRHKAKPQTACTSYNVNRFNHIKFDQLNPTVLNYTHSFKNCFTSTSRHKNGFAIMKD